MTSKTMTTKSARKLPSAYTRRLTVDPDGGYVATVHEFPGCIGFGRSGDDALSSLDDAAGSWIEAQLAAGEKLPEPANYESCSGKIALRISRRLHIQAAERAELEGTSLNQLIATAVARYLAVSSAGDELRDLLRSQLVGNRTAIYNDNRTYFELRANHGPVSIAEVWTPSMSAAPPAMATLLSGDTVTFVDPSGERTYAR